MTKMKTRKSIKKRFKITGKGKIMRGHSFKRHLRVKKKSSQKRRLKGVTIVKGSYAKKIRKRMGIKKK